MFVFLADESNNKHVYLFTVAVVELMNINNNNNKELCNDVFIKMIYFNVMCLPLFINRF
jgi:hypothetical protein